MVWNVADNENLNPPVVTQFYLFPSYRRHNQHFIFKNDMIYAKQNGMVVTYVGDDEPLVIFSPILFLYITENIRKIKYKWKFINIFYS